MCSHRQYFFLNLVVFAIVSHPKTVPALPVNGNEPPKEIKEFIASDGREYEVQRLTVVESRPEEPEPCRCYCRDKWGDGVWMCCQCQVVDSGCFPSTATVNVLGKGDVTMTSLKVGDNVLNGAGGKKIYSKILGFLHRDSKSILEYLQLTTESGHTITLSKTHIIFAASADSATTFQPIFAENVREGDYLNVSNPGEILTPSRVKRITSRYIQGLFVPFTEEGTILVDGVLASNYASFDHDWSHSVIKPLRWWPSLALSDTDEGVSRYVKMAKSMARTLHTVKVV